MRKFWIVTELFYPDETSTSYILTKVANALTWKYEVNVICSEPHSKVSDFQNDYTNLHPEVKIIRKKSIEEDKHNLLKRAARFFQLSASLSWSLFKKLEINGKVLTVTNPVPLIIFMALLKKVKKFHWSVLVHDVFPENSIPAGIMNSESKWSYKILKFIFDRAYSSADQFIVLGRDMEEVVRKKTGNKVKTLVIENWGDTKTIFPKNKSEILPENSDLRYKTVFQYAGNIGRVQGLQQLLKIASTLKNQNIHFQLIGNGAVKEELEDFVKKNSLLNVSFQGSYTREEQNEILNSADVAIVTLAKGMYGLGVPSKTYNILAAGKPILYIGEKNSEIDRLVREQEIGYSFTIDDISGLEKFFNNFDVQEFEQLKRKAVNARRIAEELYSEEKILQKFYEAL